MQRNNPAGKMEDSRVDVALFFIAPHRLRPIDVEFITDLAEYVPVVSCPLPRLPEWSDKTLNDTGVHNQAHAL